MSPFFHRDEFRTLPWTSACLFSVLLCCSLVMVSAGNSLSAQDTKQETDQADDTDEDDSNPLNFLIRGTVTDEMGDPVVGATIKTLTSDLAQVPQCTTKSRGNGAFAMKVPTQGNFGPSLIILDPTEQLASYVSGFTYAANDRKLMNVVVKPWRKSVITVVDQDEVPVGGATIVLQATFQELARQQTNENGTTTLKFPADAKVDWINALKAGQGYDYYENYDAFPSQDRLEVPDHIKLVLRGAVPVTVSVIDDLNRPVADAIVAPWTIKLPGKLSYANIGGALMEKTDANGKATVNWIPSNLEDGCTMLIHSKGFHCPKTPRYIPGETTELTADVFRTCVVSGTVSFADGTPAAGIRLQGEGRGATNHYFRGYATTKTDGTYSIDIYPNQNTILAITERNYSAASATGILLKPGDKKEVNFTLGTGTLIHGMLSVGADKGPMEGETATLIQQDNEASLVRWSTSDPEGYYHFRVGPGTYTLRLPSKAQVNVVVKDEEEIVHDSHVARRPRGQLIGKVLDQDGNPVAGAEIRGESINAPGHAGFKTQTDANGQFKTDRWMDEMLVYAVSRKQRTAGLATITDATKDLQLTLNPSAMVHGSAADEAGQPIVGQRVQLSFSPIAGGGGVNFMINTDEDGKFAFPAAIGVGCKAYLHINNDSQGAPPVTIDEVKRYEIEAFEVVTTTEE